MIFSSIIVNAENGNPIIAPGTMVEAEDHGTTQLNTESQETIVEEEHEVNIKSVSEEGGIYESYLRWEINGEEVTITDCDISVTGEVVIPETIEGLPVTSIGEKAFENCINICNVEIPHSVTTIGEKAFYNCNISGTLTIPENVTYIGDDCFTGNNINKVIYNATKCYMSFYDELLDPDSPSFNSGVAVWLGSSIFPDCKEVIFGDNVTYIPTSLAANNINITSVKLPDNLQRIQPCAFYGCSNLSEIDFPQNIKSIGFSAFENTPWLNSQPQGILYIGSIAYDYIGYSGSIEEIVIKFGTTRIESNAFADCYNLKSVIVPEGLMSIGTCAFRGCEELTTITLPDTMKDIDDSAFDGCTNLISINVSDNNENYLSDDGVLYNKEQTELIDYPNGRPGEYIVPDTISFISDYAFSGCSNMTSIIISNSVKSIGKQAFYFCDSLTTITIGSGTDTIDSDAFMYCANLSSIVVADENAYFSSIDGVLYNKHITEIIDFPNRKAGEYKIPDTITSIDDSVFFECHNLNSITISHSVVEIIDSYYGDVPFSFCENLISINVDSNNKNFLSMDGILFSKTGTTLIAYPPGRNGDYVIPVSVKSIEHGAFRGCGKLTSLVIPEGITNIANNEFGGCVNLNSISIPRSVINVGAWPFSGCNALEDVYYTGSSTDWTKITFDEDFGLPEDVLIHYNTSVPHYDSGTIIKEATCTVDGEKNYICPCGYSKIEFIPALGHVGSVVEIITPSCTVSGHTIFNCSVCGEQYTDNYIDALGHKAEVVKTVERTCVEKGYTEYRCNTCGESYVDNYIPELKHTFENDICVNCEKSKEDCIESSHNYENNCDKTWIINKPNADYITITFSSATETERGRDYIYIYDMNDNLIGQYSGTELASQTISVTGNVVKIRLTSDSIVNMYGFAVSDICSYIQFNENSVEVTMPEEIIDSNAVLKVDEIESGNIVVVLPEDFNAETAIVYDIYFEKDEQRVQPDGSVTVYIPVPNDVDGEKYKVFHLDDLGNATDMNAVYENGYMVFQTDHFSYYALVELLKGLLGDFDATGLVDSDDAIHLLCNTLFGEDMYPLNQDADVNGDGTVDSDDAVYLLCHTLFGEDLYPLN